MFNISLEINIPLCDLKHKKCPKYKTLQPHLKAPEIQEINLLCQLFNSETPGAAPCLRS